MVLNAFDKMFNFHLRNSFDTVAMMMNWKNVAIENVAEYWFRCSEQQVVLKVGECFKSKV